MKAWIAFTILFSAVPIGAAIPAPITYQGTLKQSGSAVNGSHTMIFRLTDVHGLNQYWNSGPVQVEVIQGLFSTQLSPAGVDWQSVSPYIEVTVDGQTLLPRDPVGSTVYAQMCASIADHSVLAGMIAMFPSQCPSGWTLFTPLQGRFPVGIDPANPSMFGEGAIGGALTHMHPIRADGAHNHGGTTGPPSDQQESNAGRNFASPVGGHVHTIAASGVHDHGGSSGVSDSLPPYRAVVYCQKL